MFEGKRGWMRKKKGSFFPPKLSLFGGLVVVLLFFVQLSWCLSQKEKENPSSQEPCALLFFGLAKQFKSIVLPSIKKYILTPNSKCDVYAHTYDLSQTSSPRNGEENATLHVSELGLLPAQAIRFDKIDNIPYNLTDYHSLCPPPKSGWACPSSIENMILQWISIERVWRLMERGGERLFFSQEEGVQKRKEYSRVGLFRLDVRYQNKIDIFDGDAVVPFFDNSPMNDRMFYGLYHFGKIWATERFQSIPLYLQEMNRTTIRSESFVFCLMKRIHHVRVRRRPICFNRVRATGNVEDDCRLINQDSSSPSLFSFHSKYDFFFCFVVSKNCLSFSFFFVCG